MTTEKEDLILDENGNVIDPSEKLLETNSYKEVGLMTGISKSTLIRAKREKMKLEIEN